MTVKVYDGKKTVTLTGNEGWTIHGQEPNGQSADKLYSLVSWMYRCVALRGNSVAAMPFVVKRGQDEVYEFDGMTPQDAPPREIPWLANLPTMLGKVEVATTLGGRAYFERRKNVLGTRDLSFDWMLPWSIEPIYNGIPNQFGVEYAREKTFGELLGFWRHFLNLSPASIRFEVEEVIHFWPPDYATEIGPSLNYPAKAVMANAGVIANMDVFLQGYFERGMIKATLLKYKDQISPEEAKRVKEWWKRIFTGISNAFAAEVVRGDFDVMNIGEGIKDLRDNALNNDEKKDIAIGMGIPLSKVDSTASTDANREADDRQYYEDTVIPEINWIYNVINQQILNPMGYSIIAKPQSLRVMQTDENQRSQAFANYVGNGVSIEAAIGMLGIHIPDDVEMENQTSVLQREQISRELGVSEEAALQQANQDAGGNIDKILLNGVQITAALQIVEKYAEGLFPRENAIQMYNAFLGIDPSIGQRLIPATVPQLEPPPGIQGQQNPQDEMRSLDFIALLDKRDEVERFKRWLGKRDDFNVNDYKTDLLTEHEKVHLAIKHIQQTQDQTAYKAVQDDVDVYREEIASLVLSLRNGEIKEETAVRDMQALIQGRLTASFRQGAGIADGDVLTPDETARLNEVLSPNLQLVPRFINDAIAANEKGVLLDQIKDTVIGIGSRIDMWGNALRESLNIGRIWNRNKEMELEWRIGATEQHCTDCLSQHGKVRKVSEWQQLAGVLIYPQSRALQCKGYNCDCALYQVN